MLNFRTPRARPVIKKSSPRDRRSITRVLQGLFFVGLGLVLMLVNATSVNQYKEVSGKITDLYVHTVYGQYDSNWLHISTDPQDLFLFDKNALHPKWNDQFFKGELIDVYYIDQTPKKVVALQFYDQFGVPLTKYTTSDYQPTQQGTPVTHAGFDIGVVLLMIGLLIIGFAVNKAVRHDKDDWI